VQSVKVYLDVGDRAALEAEARDNGLSLSAYLRAFAKLLKVRADWHTPTSEIAARWREILTEEGRK